MKVPNKLECYITEYLKGLPGTKTFASWVHSLVTKKKKCCEYNTRGCNHNFSFSLKIMDESNKLHYTKLERLGYDKHQLLGTIFKLQRK
jgi:hypothetical protein